MLGFKLAWHVNVSVDIIGLYFIGPTNEEMYSSQQQKCNIHYKIKNKKGGEKTITRKSTTSEVSFGKQVIFAQ